MRRRTAACACGKAGIAIRLFQGSDLRAPLTWEVDAPCPVPQPETYHSDPRIAQTQASIEARSAWLIDVAKTILAHPEPGFQEVTTARLVSEKFHELGIAHDTGLALTGLKGYIRGGTPGPTVAVLGELDSLRVPGHPHANPDTGAAHACGHHCQIAMMLGAAVGLKALEGQEALAGNIALMAVPAEEFIDVQYRWNLHQEGKLGLMAGKQELIRLGAFDDVDLAMMVHTSSSSAEAAKFARSR